MTRSSVTYHDFSCDLPKDSTHPFSLGYHGIGLHKQTQVERRDMRVNTMGQGQKNRG